MHLHNPNGHGNFSYFLTGVLLFVDKSGDFVLFKQYLDNKSVLVILCFNKILNFSQRSKHFSKS